MAGFSFPAFVMGTTTPCQHPPPLSRLCRRARACAVASAAPRRAMDAAPPGMAWQAFSCDTHLAAAANALRPLVAPALTPAREALARATAAVTQQAYATAAALDAHLSGTPPHLVVLATLLLAAALFSACDALAAARASLRRAGGARAASFRAIKSLPGISALVAREQAKMLRKLGESKGADATPRRDALPLLGMPADDVLEAALDLADADTDWTPGESQMSGCVYMADVEHFKLLNRVYARFAHSNPLHPDIFPTCARMEREVVAMTAAMLGGGRGGRTSVCGCLTSGGTESILTAIRATRDFFAAERGVTAPELIAAVSAHAAVHKACAYFGIRLVRVPVEAGSLRMDVGAVRRAVTANTILIYASAPGFPHGVVDDVAALASVARRAGVALHVDACLGGFVLPFASAAGARRLPPWDFRVPGVTSMSADTHKFGCAQKGSSVLLYANPELRRYQYTAVTDWTGGLYISPSAAGSRPGGLIAQTWASLMHMGESGYVAAAKRILDAADALAAGICAIPGLAVMGEHTMVVAFRSTEAALDIYAVNDALTAAGWHLNALQRPPALHFCVTDACAGAVPALLDALRAAVGTARERARTRAGHPPGAMAPVYGMAGGLPDRGAVGDLLKRVQDHMLDSA